VYCKQYNVSYRQFIKGHNSLKSRSRKRNTNLICNYIQGKSTHEISVNCLYRMQRKTQKTGSGMSDRWTDRQTEQGLTITCRIYKKYKLNCSQTFIHYTLLDYYKYLPGDHLQDCLGERLQRWGTCQLSNSLHQQCNSNR
jgi:hypothetical protein